MIVLITALIAGVLAAAVLEWLIPKRQDSQPLSPVSAKTRGPVPCVPINRPFKDTPDMPDENPRRFALYCCIIRSVVEKYGGTAKVDSASCTVTLNIPQNKTTACTEELQEVLGPMMR